MSSPLIERAYSLTMPQSLLQFLCTRHSHRLYVMPGQMQQLLSGKTTQIKQTTRNGLCCGEHRTGERKAGAQENTIFAEVNHLEEVMVLASGNTGDIEVQPKNINIRDFQIKQQLVNFLQSQWIHFTVKMICLSFMNCWKD